MANKPYDLPRLILSHLSGLFGQGLCTETVPMPSGKESLFIRHLDGGSSNATEMELIALDNPLYDLAQYGIHFVSSPRHADVLLITGPLSWNMLGPIQAAFEVMPEPKRIVTVGDCADFWYQDQGHKCFFTESYATVGLPDQMKNKIVAHIPGNPPTPRAIIETLVSLRPM